ncbi:MAG: Holliday junction branch migration protein RuvA [Gammaproteobacteria bacterium]|nr:Holliday junction branch migration protein RuvA [Gammaproteobacteria bacterium]
MIGRLQGQLIYKQPPGLMIDVNGVGYEVEAPMSTFYQLPECGNKVTLHIHMIVREDAQTLYGFHDLADRSLFRTLLKVNGVGAKMALTILSGMDANGFKNCIQFGDTDALVRLPGVGKKTAERLVVELRDRLDKESSAPVMSDANVNTNTVRNHIEEAISALTALGYKSPEALRMVKNVKDETSSCEDLIRLALKSSLNN